ncbi:MULTISPECIES: hypothetical protein [Sorangium]|uniref:DUF4398 domain-containing protein n=1 Tax=Sorangium cellulosum TaxID=56 RepID=A0A4P2R0X7_SORCE|nr:MULTISPECIES: hypothetical protein [Sorangium]AUX36570.1 hypothetical protein SOCE836_087780 [Sorangium cellulosum]WCQ95868.1 hypothetical protein NQZ70_08645 [Sorangium sp. Soce836]
MTRAPDGARRLRAAALALLLAAAHAPLLAACAAQASQLEQGRALRTGKQPYDEFFEAARALREESLKAEALADAARAELARAAGLDPRSAADAALDAARARAAELRASGASLHVELVPEARLVSARGGRSLDADDRDAVEALEASLKSSLAAAKQLGELSKRAAELEKQRASLAAVWAETMAGDPQRREAKRELEAAERVLAEAGAAAERHAGRASKLALDLVLAVDAGVAPAGRGAARRPTPRQPAGSAKAPPRRGSGAGAAPRPPKPPPPPRGEDDFDP